MLKRKNNSLSPFYKNQVKAHVASIKFNGSRIPEWRNLGNRLNGSRIPMSGGISAGLYIEKSHPFNEHLTCKDIS